MKDDSLGYRDDFDEFEKCQVKRNKDMLVIYRNPNSAELLREEGVDSIVLNRTSESYIEKRSKIK